MIDRLTKLEQQAEKNKKRSTINGMLLFIVALMVIFNAYNTLTNSKTFDRYEEITHVLDTEQTSRVTALEGRVHALELKVNQLENKVK